MKKKICIIAGIILIVVIVLAIAAMNSTNNESAESLEVETEIEEQVAKDFEILFYDKQPEGIEKVYTILDESETDKYDYTIYGCDGSVNIRIDGVDYSLKEALVEDMITMEEIIAKADQDMKEGNIQADMLNDGGSMEYHYENYTIIKRSTLDGNKDVYIGAQNLRINDVV